MHKYVSMRFRVELMYTFVYDLYNAIGPIKYQYIVNMPLIAFHSMELTCRKFFISDSELLPKRL
jgi:hypothetical protein